MATPRVFISSTWYDLRYIRENLKYFIRSLGYEPVLSEEGSVFYDPRRHVQDACLAEVPNCQMFVLIIGGRYGADMADGGRSVTNAEYREAVKLKIPIFALVEQAVLGDHRVHTANSPRKGANPTSIVYPSVDNPAIFAFVDEVRANAVNNALVPFRDFADIESYLRQQWAGMMFSFLTGQNEAARVTDTLAMLSEVNARVEMLSRQILKSVGTDEAKVTAALYDQMLASEAIRDLSFVGARPTPHAVLRAKSYDECASALGKPLTVAPSDDDDYSISGTGEISSQRFQDHAREFPRLKEDLIRLLTEHGYTLERFLASSQEA
jgi:hypothetical protein